MVAQLTARNDFSMQIRIAIKEGEEKREGSAKRTTKASREASRGARNGRLSHTPCLLASPKTEAETETHNVRPNA